MDPISALSIAAGIVAFVDFGAKLVSLCSDIRKSQDGRPDALSALETQARELSRSAAAANDRISNLKDRYPRQADSLARLSSECNIAEAQLQELVGSVTAGSGQGLHATVVASIRGLRKQGEIEALNHRLENIRSQVMAASIMCVWYVRPVCASLRPVFLFMHEKSATRVLAFAVLTQAPFSQQGRRRVSERKIRQCRRWPRQSIREPPGSGYQLDGATCPEQRSLVFDCSG
jgi:hypothetical protein